VPPLAVNPVDDPLQMVTFEPPLTVGSGFTLTVTVAVPLHPLAVPVTVYVVVPDGLAVTLVPVVAERLEPGAHV